jgi:hypothetical protein
MSKWMGLMPARLPANEWAGKSSEQWAFDRYLAHERCVKLVKEVDFAVRSPTYGAGWRCPFVHFYGANAFHGKRDIRWFCRCFVDNIGRPSLLEAFPEALRLAAEYTETSRTEAAIAERQRVAEIAEIQRQAIATARRFRKVEKKKAKKKPAAMVKKKPATRR